MAHDRDGRPDQPDAAAPPGAAGALALAARQPLRAFGILAVALGGWLFLAWLTLDMSHPIARLTMPATPRWSAANLLAILLMWSIMMAAMMLPSALPMLLSFGRIAARRADAARTASFATAYLVVWSVFSAAATAAQWLLQALDWVDPMLVSTSAWLNGALLLIAGVYQFSPLKRACLSSCRTPLGFLLGEWRPGARGAFVMGLRHGLLCVGCCWALMALLFVGGVMNLSWIAALAIVVAVEKLLPHGERLAGALGLALIGIGGFRLLTLPGMG